MDRPCYASVMTTIKSPQDDKPADDKPIAQEIEETLRRVDDEAAETRRLLEQLHALEAERVKPKE